MKNKPEIITDGLGNYWLAKCPVCVRKMEIVRPGKVQCSGCTA